jgi:predicted Ser/Thr protein kinase
MSRDNEDGVPPATGEPTLPIPEAHPDGQAASETGGPPAEGELTAGELISDRFRIVGRLGSGGMGVVYRADDLVLGTSVALKFLPSGLATDPVRLERLRSEVRLARRVAHPNVCRVYDIGDADGRPFLAMEYIDGEDLASLLRRIGRLPRGKAVELAREICAAVAAAHELGVVHRDLKPANVMIDGRGRARVADFGLAGAMGEIGEEDAMAGTPAYMAPEQLQGGGATLSSDIYALGLLLYEVFTGKRANDAVAVEAAIRGDSSSHTPASPSNLVDGLDPQVERAIMACLADDPGERPPSVLAVLAALPGGDPLAAALKAGEMPSPELVAASGRSGTIPRRRALQLGALAIGCMSFAIWSYGRISLDDMIGGLLPPEVLSHRAETLLTELDYDHEPIDTAWGHDVDLRLPPRLAGLPPDARRELLRSDTEPPLSFWYRSSPEPMNPWNVSLPGLTIGNTVTPIDPPLTTPGMVLVWLGPRGDLLDYRVVSNSSTSPPTRPDSTWATKMARPADRVSLVFFAFFVGGALLAVHNIRRGQWDRKGSGRLATAALILCFTGDVLASHHSLDAATEIHGFFASAAYGSVRGLMTWLLYVAIEPLIRRLHPRSMVSWSRLLAGRFSDPAVGRDVLVGLTVIAIQNAALGAWFATREYRDSIIPYWAFISGQSPLDTTNYLGVVARMPMVSAGTAFGFLLIYVVIRRLSGRLPVVAPFFLWCAVFTFFYSANLLIGLETTDIVGFAAIVATGNAYLAVRHGLLALAVSSSIGNTLTYTVLTLDPTDWFFPPTAIFVTIFVGLTIFGVKVSAERTLEADSSTG